MSTPIKTINVNGLKWFDKVNGNTYHAATITVNYGMVDARTYCVPFQYGYGEQYIYSALEKLIEVKEVDADPQTVLWRWCQDNNVILCTSCRDNCLKRELRAIG